MGPGTTSTLLEALWARRSRPDQRYSRVCRQVSPLTRFLTRTYPATAETPGSAMRSTSRHSASGLRRESASTHNRSSAVLRWNRELWALHLPPLGLR